MKSRNYLYHICVSFLFLLTIVALATATPTTAQRAQKVVRGWLRADAQHLGAALGQQITEVDIFLDAEEQPIYYVVYLQPSGFVILPADDLVEPIIAFADDGFFDPSLDNPLGALVSRDVEGRVVAARELEKTLSKTVQVEIPSNRAKWNQLESLADESEEKLLLMKKPSISDVRVAPLVLSKWGQYDVCWDYCYNYYTPNHYPCGCVATAMAQLIRYYEHPKTGIGVKCFWVKVDGNPENHCTRGGDGNGGPYKWYRMVDVPDCSTTLTQRQQIGALCYDAAISSRTEFSASSSGSLVEYAATALLDTFGYSNAVFAWNNGKNIGAGLIGMVNPNLDASYPVILGVVGPYDGHAISADGYGYDFSTLYHHLNMGWEGSDDAWYNLPDIDCSWPRPFDTIDECAYNIFTSGKGEIISGRVTDTSGDPISGATVTAKKTGETHTDATNSKGIYALPNVSPDSTYTVSSTKTGYSFTPTSRTVKTGKSINDEPTSGNRWRIDFVGSKSNNDPQLSNGYVDPNSGDTSTDFYWYVDYYDQDGDSPSIKKVYIDAIGHTMSLYSGSGSNGTYHYGPKKLSVGSHNYYFYFTDGKGGSDRLPTSGTYAGPTVEAPIDANVTLDNGWMYQNLPGRTNCSLTADAAIVDDPLGNTSYSYKWEFILPSDVTLEPIIIGPNDTNSLTFAARGCDEPNGISKLGLPFTVKVTVTGNDYGNTGTAQEQFGIALLGDVNNDRIVDLADRAIINAFWKTGSAGRCSLRDCDINCDGIVDLADRAIANAIWKGTLCENKSVTSPCPFRSLCP